MKKNLTFDIYVIYKAIIKKIFVFTLWEQYTIFFVRKISVFLQKLPSE